MWLHGPKRFKLVFALGWKHEKVDLSVLRLSHIKLLYIMSHACVCAYTCALTLGGFLISSIVFSYFHWNFVQLLTLLML